MQESPWRRTVIAEQSRSVQRALADSQELQRSALRRRRSLGILVLFVLLLAAWRNFAPRAPSLRSQAASASGTPLTAADAAGRSLLASPQPVQLQLLTKANKTS